MKRFILLMLTIALAAVPVLSCASDGDNGQPENRQTEAGNQAAEAPGLETDAATDEEPAAELRFPDLPDVNFGGYEFRIINTGNDFLPWTLTTLVVEAETGIAVNDAIFRRNRRMEERFGFTLVQIIDTPNPAGARDAARTSIMSASDDFDLAMMAPAQALGLAQAGMLEMIDQIPNINLSNPWWCQDMIRDFSIGNRVFFTAGDFTLNHYSSTLPVFFNKVMHADLGLECPYVLVKEGRWTLDRFGEQARAALKDLTGDGTFGMDDRWGYLAPTHVYGIGILNGIGARYVVKDADDLPVLNTTSEGFITRFLAAFDILTEGWLYDPFRPGAGGARTEAMFLNNQGLFWSEFMHTATVLRAMDNDFGILPFPKFDEQQEYHISTVGFPHVMCIPVTTADLERTGLILEALSAESRLSTLDVYFDTMLVNQLMNRDEESAEMFDIIFANRIYETGREFWGGSISNPLINAIRDGDGNIASIIERQEPAALADIQRTIDTFLEN